MAVRCWRRREVEKIISKDHPITVKEVDNDVDISIGPCIGHGTWGSKIYFTIQFPTKTAQSDSYSGSTKLSQ